jgi:hypothetical protein
MAAVKGDSSRGRQGRYFVEYEKGIEKIVGPAKPGDKPASGDSSTAAVMTIA